MGDEDELGPEYEGLTQGVAVPCMRAMFAKWRLTVLAHRADLLHDGSVGGMNLAGRSEAGVSTIGLGETSARASVGS